MTAVALPPSSGAQTVSTALTEPVPETARLIAGTLTHETRGFDGFVRTETVAIDDLDVRSATLQSNSALAAISLKCRTASPCIQTVSQVRVAGSVQTVTDRARELSLRCSPTDCARLFAAIRKENVPGGTPATSVPARPSTIDCNALRATYSPGAGASLPPECLSDLDRETTYQRGSGQRGNTGSPRTETGIDGGNIPSRIDFPSPSTPERSTLPRESQPVPSATQPVPGSSDPPIAAPTPVRAPLAGVNTGAARTADPDSDAPISLTLRDIFRNFTQWLVTSAKEAVESVRQTVREHAEGFAAYLFDEWSVDATEPDAGNPAAWIKGYVLEQVKDRASQMLTDATLRTLYGKSLDQMPLEFQQQKEVWDAGFKQVFGRTVSGGLDQVRAIGELLPLPVKK